LLYAQETIEFSQDLLRIEIVQVNNSIVGDDMGKNVGGEWWG
jgi:hypothetical protein